MGVRGPGPGVHFRRVHRTKCPWLFQRFFCNLCNSEPPKVTAMETTFDLSSLSEGVSPGDLESLKMSIGRCLPSSLFQQLLDVEEVGLTLLNMALGHENWMFNHTRKVFLTRCSWMRGWMLSCLKCEKDLPCSWLHWSLVNVYFCHVCMEMRFSPLSSLSPLSLSSPSPSPLSGAGGREARSGQLHSGTRTQDTETRQTTSCPAHCHTRSSHMTS